MIASGHIGNYVSMQALVPIIIDLPHEQVSLKNSINSTFISCMVIAYNGYIINNLCTVYMVHQTVGLEK